MKYFRFVKQNQAVAGVIEALLLVALVATVISTIQLVYIPQIMEQREAEHMDTVSNQFSYLKAMIDITTGSDVPVFSMITLGSKELPYFITARAFGDLHIIDTTDSRIEIDHGSLGFPAYLTSIYYEASNSYFVDQTYILEGSGIIIDQPDGESVMRVSPSISFTNGSSIVTVTFDLPIFTSVPGKNTTSGYGKCVIRTNYTRTIPEPAISNIKNIQIYTHYAHAWNESLASLFGNTAIVRDKTTYVELTLPQPSKTFTLTINKIFIHAQLGPGWII